MIPLSQSWQFISWLRLVILELKERLEPYKLTESLPKEDYRWVDDCLISEPYQWRVVLSKVLLKSVHYD